MFWHVFKVTIFLLTSVTRNCVNSQDLLTLLVSPHLKSVYVSAKSKISIDEINQANCLNLTAHFFKVQNDLSFFILYKFIVFCSVLICVEKGGLMAHSWTDIVKSRGMIERWGAWSSLNSFTHIHKPLKVTPGLFTDFWRQRDTQPAVHRRGLLSRFFSLKYFNKTFLTGTIQIQEMTAIEQCYELLSQEGIRDNGLVTVLAEIEI